MEIKATPVYSHEMVKKLNKFHLLRKTWWKLPVLIVFWESEVDVLNKHR